MVDPTQGDTFDPCLGGVLLGGSRHIWGYVWSGLRPADPCVGEVLSGGAALFFNSAICLSWPELSPPSQAEQRMGWIVHGSDCHSQRLDPLLGVKLRWGESL
jgi:hypothetical protein